MDKLSLHETQGEIRRHTCESAACGWHLKPREMIRSPSRERTEDQGLSLRAVQTISVMRQKKMQAVKRKMVIFQIKMKNKAFKKGVVHESNAAWTTEVQLLQALSLLPPKLQVL